jgi:polyhydroxyalkanoate synthesis regulator phasin
MTLSNTDDQSGEQLNELLDHLVRVTPLGRSDARRVVDEVLAYFDEPVERLVRRRHGELQHVGLANAEIFAQIASELRWWRVAAPELTERQIRRIIYG